MKTILTITTVLFVGLTFGDFAADNITTLWGSINDILGVL